MTTGEYESISWKFLTAEEQALYAGLDGNLVTSISRTIRELEIRKRRMMERISKIENDMSEIEKNTLKQLREVEQPVRNGDTIYMLKEEKMVTVEEREKVTAKIDGILAIENALNNVTNQLIRAIKQQSDLEQAAAKRDVDVYRFKDYFKNQAGTFRLVIGFYVDNGKTRLGNVRTSSFKIK